MSRFRVVFESDAPEEVHVELRVSANHDIRGERHLTESRSLLQRFNPQPCILSAAKALPYDYFESAQVEQ